MCAHARLSSRPVRPVRLDDGVLDTMKGRWGDVDDWVRITRLSSGRLRVTVVAASGSASKCVRASEVGPDPDCALTSFAAVPGC